MINNNSASESSSSNNNLISTTINQPITKYSKREMILNLPVKKSFFIVPTIDKVSTARKILIPEYSYNVIKHTGA
tara:strand:+ start:169 stop:393 length:225 start_codon:yes stop_codon:yes gene_type:complete